MDTHYHWESFGRCGSRANARVKGVYIHQPLFQLHSADPTGQIKSMPSTLTKKFLVAASVSWWIGLAVADGGKESSPAELKAEMEAEDENSDFRHVTSFGRETPVESTFTNGIIRSRWMLVALGAFAILPLLYRFISVIYARIRLLVSLDSQNQRFFATPSGEVIPWLKRNVLYAPLFRTRHNKEFQVSSAINVGTLPTRFQTFFLIGYVASNVIFCTFMIDYSVTQTTLNQMRNRTGVLATVNMIPLFLMAGRNNPLIMLLGISFDSFNLLHRWLGRIVAVESLIHTCTWMAGKVLKGGWSEVRTLITSVPLITFGLVVCLASPMRVAVMHADSDRRPVPLHSSSCTLLRRSDTPSTKPSSRSISLVWRLPAPVSGITSPCSRQSGSITSRVPSPSGPLIEACGCYGSCTATWEGK